jgi:predicted DNA-binding transcriptional regulator AlpA
MPQRFLRHEDLKPQKGISYSKAHIWRLRQLPADDPRKFPDPVKGLGPEDAWTEPEIDKYVERRIAARDLEKVA